jgi:hypothetical protein
MPNDGDRKEVEAVLKLCRVLTGLSPSPSIQIFGSRRPPPALCSLQGSNIHDSGGIFLGLIVFVLVCVLGVTIRACIDDANRRGKSPILVCVAVILFFAWGMVAWLVFRPPPINGSGGRPTIRLDKHRVQ